MPDLRLDPAFRVAVRSTRLAIEGLALEHEIPDALALYDRARGVNQLRGHAHSIIPYALLIARVFPGLLITVRSRTELNQPMERGSAESRDAWLWQQVKNASMLLIANRGDDVVAEELSTDREQTIASIADTYLSARFGGGQRNGGGGEVVIKRTMKLLAHLQYE